MDANFFTSIDNLLSKMQQDFINDSSQFLLIARIVAGLGLIVSMHFTFFKMMNSDSESMVKFLSKYMFIFLGLFYYPTFINVINVPLNAIGKSIKAIAVADDDKITAYYEQRTPKTTASPENDAEKDAELAGYMNENGEEGESETSEMITTTSNNNGFIQNAIVNAISNVLLSISNVAVLVLNIVRTFFLIVLTVFGIFVIALSAYPTLEGSFSQWLQKYINVFLWLPIGYILQGILLKLQLAYIEVNPEDAGGDFSLMTILISLCSLIGFATIPTLSSWMINAGTNGMASKLKGNSGTALGSTSKGSVSTVEAAAGALKGIKQKVTA